MITRHYMICGEARTKDGRIQRPVFAHTTRTEWRQDIESMLETFKEWAKISEDEVFVLHSITRLRGFFK